ncbi:MAG: hypothetical protein ACK40G_17850 [Cytophagaceae bacterium]
MKKISLSLIAIIIVSVYMISSCKKEEAKPAPSKTLVRTKGETQGSVTIDGTTTIVSGGSTESSFGFIMTPRNMNPPNSYPSLSVSFGAKPSKDSTYNLASTSNSVGVHTDAGSSYYVLSGNVVVKHYTDSLTATFSNLTAQKSGSPSLTVSGTVTYYDNYIYR